MQLLFSGAIPTPSEPRGVKALLGIIDPETGEILHSCEYVTPPELKGHGHKMQFTGFTTIEGRIYVCSHVEIVVFDGWPPGEPSRRITLPSFNDLHHCIPWKGGLAVANTGLETVDLISFEGELLHRWDVLSPEDRSASPIDPDLDYRTLDDTKPHYAHPNHLFRVGDSLWVTQLRTSNAVCVDGREGEIEIEAGMPHDGTAIDGRLAFTTTNGYAVFADPASREVVAVHDLKAMLGAPDLAGWCRGICPDPEHRDCVYVAFTRSRQTRWHEFSFRVRHGYDRPPTRIGRFDLASGEARGCVEVTEDLSLVIFQLQALPEPLWV